MMPRTWTSWIRTAVYVVAFGVSTSCLAGAAGCGGPGDAGADAGADAQPDGPAALTVVTLDNGRLRLELRKKVAQGSAWIEASLSHGGASNLLDPATPLWQVRMDPTPAEGASGPAAMVPPGGEDAFGTRSPAKVPSQNLIIEEVIPQRAVRITWSSVPTGVPSVLLDEVVLDVGIRDDKMFAWRLKTSLSPNGGQYHIRDAKFPYLIFSPSGFQDTGATDLLLPMEGGKLALDPFRKGDHGIGEDGWGQGPAGKPYLFGYPGEMEHQFLFLADHKAAGGVYVAAEDGKGNLKKLYYRAPGATTAAAAALHLYLRHFNTATPASAGNMLEQLRSLTVSPAASLLDYEVVCDWLDGDWFDAADRYRSWALGAGILPGATLWQKRSLEGWMAAELPYAIVYNIYKPGKTQTAKGGTDGHDDTSDLTTAINAMQAGAADLSELEPFVWVKALSSVIDMGSDEFNPPQPSEIDDYYAFVTTLHGAGRHLLFNRDTGRWHKGTSCAQPPQEPCPPDPPRNSSDWGSSLFHCCLYWGQNVAQLGSLLADLDLAPLQLKMATVPQDATCGGSPWLVARRLDYVQDNFSTELAEAAVLSGIGTVAKPCYGPLSPSSTVTGAHAHPPIGGHWWMDRWNEMAAKIAAEQANQNPYFLLGGERGPEMLSTSHRSNPGGDLEFQIPWDATMNAGEGVLTKTVQETRGVPLRQYLLHDYSMSTGGQFALTPAACIYGMGGMPKNDTCVCSGKCSLSNTTFVNYRMYQAAAFVVGDRLNLSWTSEDVPSRGLMRSYDGPEVLTSTLKHNLEFLAELVHARYRFARWLVYGRMLRFPRLEDGEGKPITVNIDLLPADAIKHEYTSVPPVLMSAWRSPGGAVALVLVNFTQNPAVGTLRVPSSSYALTVGKAYRVIDRNAKDAVLGVIQATGAQDTLADVSVEGGQVRILELQEQ